MNLSIWIDHLRPWDMKSHPETITVSSKHFKILHHIRFSYKEFNEHDKLKFENDLVYFLN
jgi:sulfur relay (sulfurtransferase) DsrC/TusE family protein